MRNKTALALLASLTALALVLVSRSAPPTQAEPIPHGQDRMPGAPLTAAEAVQKMTLPPGFTAEVVACEPDIVNPVAMTFDEKGRIWITESLEYPRQSPGPGRDRIKVLESTRGDGHYDKITVFADGLNIPSGIAVGSGGVWVANSPDIVFLQDTHGTGKADRREVVVTGFGRYDTHEVPSSLNWGPDGYLYGLNGVFNPAHIRQNGKDFDFTCAMYRIDPKTRRFQIFAEGTSNPWGMAWDTDGSVFISACVVDHLWHLAETGYYLRQGGPYPPHTWILPSIVHHHHQKAAYCGLCWFDSDAYPPEYRDKLYMGNIHGDCVNVDEIHKRGATYSSKPCPDFLTANDAWFMPVSQKVGPDGCLYILDWYDRYHCYQDAQRDPAGIDRLRGRLYRIRYRNTPPAGKFDLAKESDDQLIARLHSPNIYFRDQAQRVLRERNHSATRPKLEKLVLDDSQPHKARMHALWALIGTGSLDALFHEKLLHHHDPIYRAWAVRAAGNFGRVSKAIRQRVAELGQDKSPEVLLQAAVASRKIEGMDALPVLVDVLRSCGNDPLIPAIVWQNLYPLLHQDIDRFPALVEETRLQTTPGMAATVPHLIEYLLGSHASLDRIASMVRVLTSDPTANITGECVRALTHHVEAGELTAERLEKLRILIGPTLRRLALRRQGHAIYEDVVFLQAAMHDNAVLPIVRQFLVHSEAFHDRRMEALHALIAAHDPELPRFLPRILSAEGGNSQAFRSEVLAALAQSNKPQIGEMVLAAYPNMEADLRPKAIELLIQRPAWSKSLLQAVAAKKVSADALNVNQLRQLLHSRDPEIVREVKATWGTVRDGRNPERERVVAKMAVFLRQHPGNPQAGRLVFKNLCGQCHRIYGEGADVGPDLTNNGRGSFDQLLSNVFDPSLVIGAGYQATTVTTTRGRIITGLIVENNAERVVLKQQGGKLETIPRRDIDQVTVSKVSLMPEGLEKQLKPPEISDLFAFLELDRPPDDPKAKKIPGSP